MSVRVTPYPVLRVVESVELVEAFCSTCGLLVAHEPSGGRFPIWVPIEHDAPECDRPCVAGGVSRDTYHLGVAHRVDCARCDADLILW